MIRSKFAAQSAAAMIAVALTACTPAPRSDRLDLTPDVARVLEEADRWTIYGLETSRSMAIDGAEKIFHGHEILSAAQLTDAEARAELTRALNGGMAENRTTIAACFSPRHGIHAELPSGEIADLVICFECLQFYIFDASGDKVASEMTSESPSSIFNRVYRSAGVSVLD